MVESRDQMGKKAIRTKGEKEGIAITEDDVGEIRAQGEYCSIGRIWAEKKKINKEAFKTVLSQIWHAEGCVPLKEMQENLWFIEFSERQIKEGVMVGRPWSFERQILTLNEFNGLVPPSRMDFFEFPALMGHKNRKVNLGFQRGFI